MGPVGAHDVVKDAFTEIGRIDLWRIAVQPGRPLAFGRAPANGRSAEVLLFGLPGNPVSSLVTFELFVRPVLRRLAGHRDVIGRDIVRATLDTPVTKAPKRRTFLRVSLTKVVPGAGDAAPKQAGVRVLVGEQAASMKFDVMRAVTACVETAAGKITPPKPTGPPGSYVTAEFSVIAR